jgi:hypothetical protein
MCIRPTIAAKHDVVPMRATAESKSLAYGPLFKAAALSSVPSTFKQFNLVRSSALQLTTVRGRKEFVVFP